MINSKINEQPTTLNSTFEQQILTYKNVGKHDKELEIIVNDICKKTHVNTKLDREQNLIIEESTKTLCNISSNIYYSNNRIKNKDKDAYLKKITDIWKTINSACKYEDETIANKTIYDTTINILCNLDKQNFAKDIYAISPYHSLKIKKIDKIDALDCHDLSYEIARLQFDYYTHECHQGGPFYLIPGKGIHSQNELGEMKKVMMNHIQTKHPSFEITPCKTKKGVFNEGLLKLNPIQMETALNCNAKEFIPSK